jgi:hypothetical protein
MLSTDTAGLVWEAILNAGAVPMGATAWEQLRVWHGTVFFWMLTIFSLPYIVKNHHHKKVNPNMNLLALISVLGDSNKHLKQNM